MREFFGLASPTIITRGRNQFPSGFACAIAIPRAAMADALGEYLNEVIQVITNDGKIIVGKLLGFDQITNLILDKCQERIFSAENGVQLVEQGFYMIRGDSVAIVGALDGEKERMRNLSDIRAPPLPPLML